MRTIGIQDLEHNASGVLREVEADGEVLVAVAGRPVAVLMSLDRRHRWVPTREIDAARCAVGEPDWPADLIRQRRDGELRDPLGD